MLEFANRYDVIRRIGKGGMGEVYLAHDNQLDRDVALKFLGKEYVDDRQFVERFKREARSAAGINHPNVVQVHDTGEGVFEGRNVPYISMEYVPGNTLKDLIVQRRGPLPVPTAVDLALQVAKALRAAHGRGVIHRDIKPANILLTNEGEAKVADFGIAKAADWTSLTEVGDRPPGTRPYMSPEQWLGNEVGPESDLYSLGIVLYEMLTGKLPFEGTEEGLMYKHLHEQPRAPREINPDVPEQINAITMRLLAKEPGKRYPSAAALIEELEDIDGAPHPKEEDKKADVLPTVPYVSGRSIEEARWAIEGAGLVPAGSRRKRSRDRSGTVLASDPPAGTQVYPGTPVTLTISSGSRRMFPWIMAAALALIAALLVGLVLLTSGNGLEAPDLAGMTQDAAERAAGDDFDLEVSASEASDEPRDTILSQDPEPGELVQRGSAISVVMSAGPEEEANVPDDTLEVPDLAGMTQDAAERAAGDDFDLEFGGSETSDEPRDTILRQDPESSEQAEQGSTIFLVMSAGPEEEATVPDESASGVENTDGQSTGIDGSSCPASYEADWSSGMDGWAGSSDWKHVSGMLVNDGSNSEGSISAPCRPGTQDYAIEAEVQIIDPIDDCYGYFDLVARTGIYGGFFCRYGDGELEIATTEDDVAGKDFAFDGGRHVWRLEVQGNTSRLFMDGAPLLQGADNSYLDSGEIGMYTSDLQINVRSFRYTEL